MRPEGKSGGHGVGWSEIAQVIPPATPFSPANARCPGLPTASLSSAQLTPLSICDRSVNSLQYKFDVPPSFDEIPVSIADLGGAELDLRFQSAVEGDIAVLVAPVMRFRDIGFNADVTIEELFEPPALIRGFGPELIAKQIEDDDIVSMEIVKKDGRQYYEYELNSKHLLVRGRRAGSSPACVHLSQHRVVLPIFNKRAELSAVAVRGHVVAIAV